MIRFRRSSATQAQRKRVLLAVYLAYDHAESGTEHAMRPGIQSFGFPAIQAHRVNAEQLNDRRYSYPWVLASGFVGAPPLSSRGLCRVIFGDCFELLPHSAGCRLCFCVKAQACELRDCDFCLKRDICNRVRYQLRQPIASLDARFYSTKDFQLSDNVLRVTLRLHLLSLFCPNSSKEELALKSVERDARRCGCRRTFPQ